MPQTDPNQALTAMTGTFTATTNGSDQKTSAAGGRFFLAITAASGTTPTLNVKIQVKDPVSGNYVDLLNAAFAQQTGTGTFELTVYPGVATAANQAVSYVLSGTFRVVATIGGTTPSFTFTVSFLPLW